MELGMSMRPRLEQRLKMAPQIIQSIEILQLPLLALQERIEQEQLENPLLDTEETDGAEASGEPQRELSRAETAETKDEFQRVERVSDDYHDYFWQTSSRRPASGDKDEKLEATQNTPGPLPSLREHLMSQIRFLDLSTRQRDICEAIINNLDRDGRLCFPLEEIAASLDDPPPGEDLERALGVVQALDPPGVGARDLVECLLLQLDPDDEEYALQGELIRNHLMDIEANRFPKIARETKRTMEEVKATVATVCMLHPAPGRLYDNEVIPTVVPDVHVELLDGRLQVRLDEKALPRLRINPDYRHLLSDGTQTDATRQFVQKKIESARWLIDSIQQRRRTLRRVSREIVGAQQEFFERGLSYLRPLKMQEVADEIGMHVATVSRAIRHKYMQTARGLFPMKFFFSGGTRSGEGDMETWGAVKQRIQKIVDGENKDSPYSDEDIVKTLATQGIKLARRTVTKYRKALNIPPSRQRKQY